MLSLIAAKRGFFASPSVRAKCAKAGSTRIKRSAGNRSAFDRIAKNPIYQAFLAHAGREPGPFRRCRSELL